MKKEELYKVIAQSSIYGNLGLFIGAGLPMAILNSENHKVALSWKELINKCFEEFEIDFESVNKEGSSYPEIATQLCKLYAEKEKIDYGVAVKKLKELISNFTCWYPEFEKRIEFKNYFDTIEPNWIITTNYDLVIECILNERAYSLTPSDQLIAPKKLIPVYHLHGIRTNPDSIIITQEDYISLFRPNQYRQQKLPLTIKESVTLLIGYNLGDFNVLTAVDWSKNVFSDQKINYPQTIIQFYFTDEPRNNPYIDNNGIIIFEFNDLSKLLNKIANIVLKNKEDSEKHSKKLSEINELFKNPTNETVKNFIDDEKFRIETLKLLEEVNINIISGFLELFSKSIEETWERAKPRNAFWAYDENLTILLDILKYIKIYLMPPALIEAVSYNLDRVAGFVGDRLGQSRSAFRTWENRKESIPEESKKELINIANARDYYHLNRLLK